MKDRNRCHYPVRPSIEVHRGAPMPMRSGTLFGSPGNEPALSVQPSKSYASRLKSGVVVAQSRPVATAIMPGQEMDPFAAALGGVNTLVFAGGIG
jgi:hypothetical protein